MQNLEEEVKRLISVDASLICEVYKPRWTNRSFSVAGSPFLLSVTRLSLTLSLSFVFFRSPMKWGGKRVRDIRVDRGSFGPSRFEPNTAQYQPARPAVLRDIKSSAQTRPAPSLNGPIPRSRFSVDITIDKLNNFLFCVEFFDGPISRSLHLVI